MRLTNLEIKNFRGIKHANVFFPQNSRIVCLIGAGDSGKSTLLSAIEWVLWPTWNLNATDMDFYNCDTTQSIVITASIAEMPDNLLTEDKFGLYLRNEERRIIGGNDEPKDDGTNVLTIRLTVNEDLEPKWEVITDRTEPKTIGHKDRRLLAFGAVGFDQDKDFQWGRYSVLQKYADSRDALHNAFTQAMRSAVENTNLEALDQMAPTLKKVGQEYGVGFTGEIHNRIIMQSGSYSTTVGVFDDKVPFAQRGLGSRRLLSIGMNINAYSNGTLVLVDEVETGLEPYRISALVNQFRSQFKESGQLIITTHSASVLCECTVDEVATCTNNNGELSVNYFGSDETIKDEIQAQLRGNPDAFLCKRVIACEGKTEVGMLRALDKYRRNHGQACLAHYGVGMIPGGGGDKFFKLAKLLHNCGYDVSILMDSDISEEETEKTECRNLGIPVFDWEQGHAIEEELFKNVSLECINAMLALAIDEKSFDHVSVKLKNAFAGENLPFDINSEMETITALEGINEEERLKIGTVAKQKNCEWYKNTSLGEAIGDEVFREFETLENCRFKEQMFALQKWVTGDEK